jgi:hypothetical protein
MKKYDKLQVSDDEALGFIDPAMYIVDTYVKDMTGKPLEGERRVREIMHTSTNMAAGSIWTIKKYLLIGGILGAAYLAAGLLGYSLGKNEDEEES